VAQPWATADSQKWKFTGSQLLLKLISSMLIQRNQQVDVRKPTVAGRRGICLELLCLQQVYVQLPQVAVQHPFWGDVSPFSRCEAAFSNPTRNLIRLEPSNLTQTPSET
jgi:hypothetical protein